MRGGNSGRLGLEFALGVLLGAYGLGENDWFGAKVEGGGRGLNSGWTGCA